MDKVIEKRVRLRTTRALRVRKHLRGSKDKPRMCVVKTNKHIYAQLIDDDLGKTLCSISTCSESSKKNKESARVLGQKLAEKAKLQGIAQVMFDRGPFKYHGILAALADGARENGLQF